jgi:hypothetical protein
MSHERLTTFGHDPLLDLDPWVGQRQASFRFDLVDGVTGENRGQIHPLRSATLTHDTTRTIKRQLNLNLGVEDTATINAHRDRVLLYMTFPNGAEYPLGRYMFTDSSRELWTTGRLGSMVLNDEMFMVDQEIEQGIDGFGKSLTSIVEEVVEGLAVTLDVAPSPFTSSESWPIGAHRGSILESISVSGDYFSPWFGNDTKLHMIRSFDPSTRFPDFDWDNGNQVMRDSIVETDNLLTAPNRFIITSNAAADPNQALVSIVDVPPTAPHSIVNRGFAIPETIDLQLNDQTQSDAVATGIANRFTIFERVSLSTAPDPRHDSYNVIFWRGDLWLELAWGMALVEGGAMSHLIRKAYQA